VARGWTVAASRQRPVHVGLEAKRRGRAGGAAAASAARVAALRGALLDAYVLGGGAAVVGVASGFNAAAYFLGGADALVWVASSGAGGEQRAARRAGG